MKRRRDFNPLRRLASVILLCLGGMIALPLVAAADCTPITVEQMFDIAESGGGLYEGAPYLLGGNAWNPWNHSVMGTDCAGYVGKAWQVYRPIEVSVQDYNINTAGFYCGLDCWSRVDRAGAQQGDAFTNDTGCIGGSSVHVILYGWGPPLGTFALYEATSLFARVIHRSAEFDESYVAVRRGSLQDPGIIGRRPNGTHTGEVRQPIIDAYNRNGGNGNVGKVYYNGGGFLAHDWGNGNAQDFIPLDENSHSGLWQGVIMQPNSRSDMAYWVHGRIREVYSGIGGPGTYGYPLSDEFYTTPVSLGQGSCGWDTFVPTMDFEQKYARYNCAAGDWQFFNYPSAYGEMLQNRSFETGTFLYWHRFPRPFNAAIYAGGAYDGTYFLAFNSGGATPPIPQPGETAISWYQDVPEAVVPGQNYTARVWVRCRTSTGCSVNLAVWGLNQSPNENFSTGWRPVAADGLWHEVSIRQSFSGRHDSLRFELYSGLSTEVDIDFTSLTRS